MKFMSFKRMASCVALFMTLQVGGIPFAGVELAYGAEDTQSIQTSKRPPVMGWSSWNKYHININEQLIQEQADAMVSSGMKEAGYQFVNLDDGWFGGRDANNVLQSNVKFPSGMKALADYIHSKGLKAGIYTDAGRVTCASIYDNDPYVKPGDGSYDHRQLDFDTFIKDWGYDFVKVDWCGGQRMNLDPQTEYTKIKNNILATGRDVVFEVCNWAFPGAWVTDIADHWRISGDIRPNFQTITQIIDINASLAKYAKPGHYNHMDMLEVGNGMSYEEDKSHFSMWAIMASPLLAGNDLRNMSEQTRSILTNKEVIAVNQDAAGIQGIRVVDHGDREVWAKALGSQASGEVAVALFNRGSSAADITVNWDDIGIVGSATVRDLWEHQDKGSFANSYTANVPSHGIVVVKVKGQSNGIGPVLPVGYEAESPNNTLSGEARIINHSAASGGKKVGWIGNNPQNTLRFNKIQAERAGDYLLTVYYFSGESRGATIRVNDEPPISEMFPVLSNWNTVGSHTIKIRLKQGDNTITFSNDSAYAPDIDKIGLKEIRTEPATLLTGNSSVQAGNEFNLSFGLRSIQQPVYAQDIKIQYDSSLMEFVAADSLQPGVKVLHTKGNAGSVRLIVASEGKVHAIIGEADVLELGFKAKGIAQPAIGTIAVAEAMLGDEQGSEAIASTSSFDVSITPAPVGIPGDVNGDKKVSIGDLAIAATHYGKNSDSPDWQQIKAADVSGDGVIDITDLAMIANIILE